MAQNQQESSFDAACPGCKVLLGQEHTKDCGIIATARQDYMNDDIDVSLRSGVEKVDGGYWVEAWVYVYSEEDDEEPEATLFVCHDLQCTTCGITLNDQCLEDGCTEEYAHPGTSSYCGECIVEQDITAEHA